jgi:ADP-ribose pyrophosphatase
MAKGAILCYKISESVINLHHMYGDVSVRIVESRQVYSGAISMRLDKFSINGRILEKEIVEHRPSVGIVAVDDDDDDDDGGGYLMLVRQYRHAAGKTLLEIPAGKMEEGETPRQAALREMNEEIGYSGRLRPFLKWYMAPGYDTELMHLFVATELKKVTRRGSMDDDEDIVVKKISLAAAVKKCFSGEIQDAKTIAAILAYTSQP